MDDQDVGEARQMVIDVNDPCLTPSLTINDSVFKTPPTLTLEQFVDYLPLQMDWDDSIISTIDPLCGPLTHEVADPSLPILSLLSLDQPNKSLALQSSTPSGNADGFVDYSLQITVYFTSYMSDASLWA